jgi:hypothetical protein
MKKGRSLLVVGAFVMSFSVAFGQGDYAFKVLANKGTNEVKSGNTWVAVKTGAALKKDDELKLAENSYVGLVSAGGKPLELKASGSYKVTELLNKVAQGTSVLNKYTDFILSSNSAEAKKNRLSATGAVHRGPKELKVFLPDNSKSDVYNSKVIISWEKANGPYVVSITNMFDDKLGTIETPETTATIDLSDAKYASEPTILVQIASKGDGKLVSKQHLVKKLNAAQAEKIKTELSQVAGDLGEETAFNKYLLAGFYEEHKLYIDAITAYQQAIKMAPDVPTYKEAFDEFLIRNVPQN